MNLRAFFAACRSEWPFFDDPGTLSTALHPTTRRLEQVPERVRGMATENILMLLNLGARHLDDGEVYVEVGSWNGLTLAGAMNENPNVTAFACDNFSQFGGNLAALQHTIEREMDPRQVSLFDMDAFDFLRRAPWRPKKVGVYFYDGGHTFIEQVHAIVEILPQLSDPALLVIDDGNWAPARAAVRLLVQRIPTLVLVQDIRTPGNQHPTWWNGVLVLTYSKPPDLESRQARAIAPGAFRTLYWGFLYPRVVRATGAIRNLLTRLKNRLLGTLQTHI